MSRVVGIDFSMTCTGVGVLSSAAGQPRADTFTVTSTGKRADSLPARRLRLRTLASGVMDLASAADLAVIELPTNTVKGGSELDRHFGWWLIVDMLMQREVPVATVTSSSLKLAIAGKGNADKAAMAVGVERLWPGMDVSSSDVSDALGLAHLGAVWLGWDVPTLDRHRQVKAVWPEFPAPPAQEVYLAWNGPNSPADLSAPAASPSVTG